MKHHPEKTRKARMKRLHPSESLFSSSWIANILTMVFTLVDFMTLYSVWNYFLEESPFMLILLALGFAMILDIPLAIAGNVWKQYNQKLRPKKEALLILLGSILAFTVVFSTSFAFRMETREETFQSQSTGGLTAITDDETAEEEPSDQGKAKLLAALTLAVLPCATSIASFVVSYAVSNPLRDRRRLLETERVEVENEILELERKLVGLDNLDKIQKEKLEEDEMLYASFLQQIEAQGVQLKMGFRRCLMEALADADSDTKITKDSDTILAIESDPDTDPDNERPTIVA